MAEAAKTDQSIKVERERMKDKTRHTRDALPKLTCEHGSALAAPFSWQSVLCC